MGNNYARVILTGFRGSGKTTIGRELSKLLRWQYISTDEMIETRAKMSIAGFVKKEGWASFRRLESEIIQSLKDAHNVVIDCGGGVVENEENMQTLSSNALVVWVDAALDDIFLRLQHAGDRPHLSHRDLRKDIEKNYRRRVSLYRRYSHIRVTTSESDTTTICRYISDQLC